MADSESCSFVSMTVPELQNFLKARDIQIAVGGKKRKRVELLEVCKNAAEMKVQPLLLSQYSSFSAKGFKILNTAIKQVKVGSPV